jgi:catechol 2,3-dioxygenase-like lactoylglutathione lyase family enzyme
MSAAQVARRRGVSRDAVKFHIANAIAKLGLASRAELRSWRGMPADSALARQAKHSGDDMTEDTISLGSIGQIARPVSDVPRAVEWYSGVLGLPHLYTFGDLAFFDCGGVRLFLSQHDPGKGGEPPVLYFRVPDINTVYDALRARGVQFRGAPHMIFRHESGVEEWMAFFDDCDGHPLAIMERVEA